MKLKQTIQTKTYTGTNVRVSDAVYNEVVRFTEKNGGKIGKFFEIAAEEKLKKSKKV